MDIQALKNHIITSLVEDEIDNAFEFVEYLEVQGMQFELSETDYWKDKQYWYVKFQNEFVGYILINGHSPAKDETEPDGWVFWSDNYNSAIFSDFPLDNNSKNIAYNHVDFGTCGGGTTVKVFGREFTPVCNGTTFRFSNPNQDEICVMKKLVYIRKLDIANLSE